MNNINEDNPGKKFWSALSYIIDSFREYGEKESEDEYGVDHKSITISKEEWEVLDSQFDELERAITDTWKGAVQLAKDAEDYSETAEKIIEEIINRFDNFVDDSNKGTGSDRDRLHKNK